jgi:tetratricopeptide (TPR) repeat protein
MRCSLPRICHFIFYTKLRSGVQSLKSLSACAAIATGHLLLCPTSASALTAEAAVANCRASTGRPMFLVCMRKVASREACMGQAVTLIRACAKAALNAANGRANTAVAVPAEATPKASGANPLPEGFLAPPRTIADIAAILDSEKPDADKLEQLRSAADRSPPLGVSRAQLAQFYYDRGNARALLGRLAESISDAEKAVETGRGASDDRTLARYIQFEGMQYSAIGNPKRAVEIFARMIQQRKGGFGFNGYRMISAILLQMGDTAQADAYLRKTLSSIKEARTSGLPLWRKYYDLVGQSWESDVEANRALLFEAHGQFREAEVSYHLAEARKRASVKGSLALPAPPPEALLLQTADGLLLSTARMKARQGRLAEAEVDARRALLARLKDQGKYNPTTTRYIMGLAEILVEEGHYADAEKLARVSLEINRTVGVPDDSIVTVQLLSQFGGILDLQRKTREAIEVYS